MHSSAEANDDRELTDFEVQQSHGAQLSCSENKIYDRKIKHDFAYHSNWSLLLRLVKDCDHDINLKMYCIQLIKVAKKIRDKL